jgi:hypothetical protein
VPDVTGCSEQRDVAKIGEHLARRTNETQEPMRAARSPAMA